jgi:hypothetical protein
MTRDEERRPDVMQWIFLFVQVLFAAAALVGIWLIYPPAALIVGGVAGVWAMERSLAADAALKLKKRPTPQVRRVS